MLLILPRPVYPPRSGRATRSGPVWQDISFKQTVSAVQEHQLSTLVFSLRPRSVSAEHHSIAFRSHAAGMPHRPSSPVFGDSQAQQNPHEQTAWHSLPPEKGSAHERSSDK
jgi:hypothetical protein